MLGIFPTGVQVDALHDVQLHLVAAEVGDDADGVEDPEQRNLSLATVID